MLRLLIDFGGDIEWPNNDGATLLCQAASAADANLTLELLLRLGADPNQTDNAGWSALHRAASCGYRRNVSELLRHGADPTMRTVHGLDVPQIADAAGHANIFSE